MRGWATQPSKMGHYTGDPVGEVPDALMLLKTGGVEVLEVSFSPIKGWTSVSVRQGRVSRLIQSPADVFYYSGHAQTYSMAISVGDASTARTSYDDWFKLSLVGGIRG